MPVELCWFTSAEELASGIHIPSEIKDVSANGELHLYFLAF